MNSRVSGKEGAQTTTEVYKEVHDRGMRKPDIFICLLSTYTRRCGYQCG